MEFVLKDVQANPFRKIENYPFQKEKIEALKESIESTTFWDNVVARAVNGHAEIAYGHHRLEALRQLYGEHSRRKVNLIVRDLNDEQMLKIMARENLEEWGSSAIVEQETVRAVLQAYRDGLIELGPLPKNTPQSLILYATDNLVSRDTKLGKGYTAQMLANFIGWKNEHKAEAALKAIDHIEKGLLAESDFSTLKSREALVLVQEMNKAQRKREIAARNLESEGKAAQAQRLREEGKQQAAAIGKAVAKDMREGGGYRRAVEVAAAMEDKKYREKAPPEIDRYAQTVARGISTLLDDNDERIKRLDRLVRYREYLSDDAKERLADALGSLGARAFRYATTFGYRSRQLHRGDRR